MGQRERLEAVAGGRWTIVTIGAAYVAAALVLVALEVADGPTAVDVPVVIIFVVGPGLVLCYGGYRLPRTGVERQFVPTVTLWCLGAIAVMIGLLGLYQAQPGTSLTSPVQNTLVLTSLAAVAGYGAGVNNAAARSRTSALRKYETTLETVWDGVTMLDADDRFLMVNEAFCELTGYDREELIGEPATLVLDDSTYERAGTLHDQVADGDLDVATMEYDLIRSDGSTIPVEARFGPTQLEDGTWGGTGVIRDISDRIERQRTLERRTRQQRAVSSLGQLALETDDIDEVMDAAARQTAAALEVAYCKVLDLDSEAEELLLRQGVGWQDGIVGQATVSAVEADSQAAFTLATDEPVVVEDLNLETRFNGPELLTSHEVRSGISTIIGPVDDPWGILGVHDTAPRQFADEDVSFVQSVANVLAEAIRRRRYQLELEELVDELSASNERLEHFAHAASHDLQEPLRMVSSYLQLLEHRYRDELDEDAREYIDFAVDGVDRMRSMIDGLLEYSRVDTQAEPFGQADLEGIVNDAMSDLEVQIAESDAAIRVGDLPTVEGDTHQLRQVFQNLLRNAIEHSGDENPRIEISAERNGATWVVSVEDEGVGIDPADQERIFELFERVDPHSEAAGSGIGLALCERVVERHGGDIWVESGPDEGATFSFSLPM